jgi:hypothetical protein
MIKKTTAARRTYCLFANEVAWVALLMTMLMKIEADDNEDDGRQQHPTWLEDGL